MNFVEKSILLRKHCCWRAEGKEQCMQEGFFLSLSAVIRAELEKEAFTVLFV